MGREFSNSDVGGFRRSPLPPGEDDGGDLQPKKDEDSEDEEDKDEDGTETG